MTPNWDIDGAATMTLLDHLSAPMPAIRLAHLMSLPIEEVYEQLVRLEANEQVRVNVIHSTIAGKQHIQCEWEAM